MKWLRYEPCLVLVCKHAHFALLCTVLRGYLEVAEAERGFLDTDLIILEVIERKNWLSQLR